VKKNKKILKLMFIREIKGRRGEGISNGPKALNGK
jgi:hypothetical protein